MYALRIRKSDLALLTDLNGGVEPEVGNGKTYLIVNPGGENEILTEKDFFAKYEPAANGPVLIKLKKSRY